MRKVEEEEQMLCASQPSKKLFHHSIVNLVIGSVPHASLPVHVS